MKNPKTKVKWVSRTLIHAHYHIALCTSEKNFNYEMQRLKVPRHNWPKWLEDDADAMTHEFESIDHKLIVIVCIHPNDKNYISNLHHEAVHIWQKEEKCIGEENTSPEFEAYSIQAISENLINAYKGKK